MDLNFVARRLVILAGPTPFSRLAERGNCPGWRSVCEDGQDVVEVNSNLLFALMVARMLERCDGE